MIPINFTYSRPENLTEALEAFTKAEKEGLKPLYLAGGTEITTFCRNGTITPGALVDIKRIPDCLRLDEEGGDRGRGRGAGSSIDGHRQTCVRTHPTQASRTTVERSVPVPQR